jgi:hypothetical protein
MKGGESVILLPFVRTFLTTALNLPEPKGENAIKPMDQAANSPETSKGGYEPEM